MAYTISPDFKPLLDPCVTQDVDNTIRAIETNAFSPEFRSYMNDQPLCISPCFALGCVFVSIPETRRIGMIQRGKIHLAAMCSCGCYVLDKKADKLIKEPTEDCTCHRCRDCRDHITHDVAEEYNDFCEGCHLTDGELFKREMRRTRWG